MLALDRAIDRGARSPTTLSSLLDAGAESVLLDSNLTLAELVDLGQAFSEFDPDSLNRLSLRLETINDADGTYQGEQIIEDVNDGVLDVFRGAADSVRPSEVAVSVIGSDEASVTDAVTVLSGPDVGFEIVGRHSDAESLPQTVIVHGPGARQGAILLARHVDPVPFVVEDPEVNGITLALGADYRGIFWLVATPQAAVEEAVAGAGPPERVPDLHPELFEPTSTLAPTSTSGTAGAVPTTSGAGEVEDAGTEPESLIATTTSAGTRGRPPPGESCG